MAIITFFGVPGSGKTTFAAKIVATNLKHGFKTYSNVPIIGSVQISKEDLGFKLLQDADLIIDEAGIDFNSRAYKSLPQQTIRYLKLYRHFGIRNIYIFSQSYDDMDITLRRLSDRLYLVRRSLIPHLYYAILIALRIGIDKETHQIQDQYFFRLTKLMLVWGKRYYHLFDSWQHYNLPAMQESYFGLQSETLEEAKSEIRGLKKKKPRPRG